MANLYQAGTAKCSVLYTRGLQTTAINNNVLRPQASNLNKSRYDERGLRYFTVLELGSF